MAKRNSFTQDNTQMGRGNTFGVEQPAGLGHPEAESRPIVNAELAHVNQKLVTVMPHPGIRHPQS